jgi:hypothetical protein
LRSHFYLFFATVFLFFLQSQHISGCNHTVIALYLFFCNCFFAIAVTCYFFATVFSANHIAIRLQSRTCLFLATTFLQSPHISGCNRTVTYFAITRIFIRLQHNEANTNLVAIW